MRRLVVSLFLSLVVFALACGDPDPACEPACRDGFACVRGMCVSACNPACGPGEVCMSGARCVPADLPDSASVTDDSGLLDASGLDVGVSIDAYASDDSPGADSPGGGGDDAFVAAVVDAAVADAGPPRCDPGMALCGGACRAPTGPEVGVRSPTTGVYGMDFFDTGALAVDPCTGTMGLVYPQQVSRSDNDEIYLMILPAALGGTPVGPIRVTTAPGPATSVAIAWARDRFFLFWSDPRHDPAPETCTRCLSELYAAAYDASGTLVTPETRLTTGTSSATIASIVAVAHPASGETLVAWTDSADRQVSAGIVGPDAAMRARQVVSAATSPQRGNSPHVVWNDGWILLYRHDDPDGARPDYLHTRAFLDDGTLRGDVDLRVPAEQIAFASRAGDGYVTVTTDGSSLAMRLWDRAWTATTTLPVTSGTFDGTRGLGWDGTSLYLTDSGLSVSVVRFNALGTETGRVPLTSDPGERSASDLVMHVVGTRLVLGWVHATSPGGSVVHHRIQVVDTSAFP